MFNMQKSRFLKPVLLGFLLCVTQQVTKAQNTDVAFQTVAVSKPLAQLKVAALSSDWKSYFDQKLDEYYSKMTDDTANSAVWAYCALSAWMRSTGDTKTVQKNIKENVNWIKKSWKDTTCPCADVIPESYWIEP